MCQAGYASLVHHKQELGREYVDVFIGLLPSELSPTSFSHKFDSSSQTGSSRSFQKDSSARRSSLHNRPIRTITSIPRLGIVIPPMLVLDHCGPIMAFTICHFFLLVNFFMPRCLALLLQYIHSLDSRPISCEGLLPSNRESFLKRKREMVI